MNDQQSVIELLAEAIEVNPETLTPATRISDVEDWTSIAWLTIMAMLDERLSMQISAKTIRGFETVGDVTGYVLQHQPA